MKMLDTQSPTNCYVRLICSLLLRCNYGHVPYGMVSEIWQMVDVERAGTLHEDGLMV
jgi:hypothetical protein